MKYIFKSIYICIFLWFTRRILAKMTLSDCMKFEVKHTDHSGCWDVLVAGHAVDYSYSRDDALKTANSIYEKCPNLRGRIKLEENDELAIAGNADIVAIPGITAAELNVLLKLTSQYI